MPAGRPKGSKNVGRRPQQIKPHHQWVCWLDAAGMRVSAIAKETGVTTSLISRLRGTRLYLALRAQYAEEIIDKGMKEATAHLMTDAPENIRFLRDLRDGELDDCDADARRDRLAAARELLGIQFPKKTESKSDSTHRFILEAPRREKLLTDCTEAGVPIIPLTRAISDARDAYEAE